MTNHIQIAIDQQSSHGVPEFKTELKRVNVILGSTGSGKSRVLTRLRDRGLWGGRTVIWIEGGRVITPPERLQTSEKQFSSAAAARKQYEANADIPLASRLHIRLALLDRLESTYRIEHSIAVEAYADVGSDAEIPAVEGAPLSALCQVFNRIFPDIVLSLDTKTKDFRCIKNGSEYTVPHLSDGERQVLALLAELLVDSPSNAVVIVDEPELNLNPELACRVWDTIESELDTTTFVYSTHSLQFATRSSVQTLHLLGGTQRQAIHIPDVENVDADELEQFLRVAQSRLSYARVLLVEGTDTSIDDIVYRWLFQDTDIQILSGGSSDQIKSAINGAGIWALNPIGTDYVGVIDRDYAPDDELDALKARGCEVLDFHELESFFCVPEIFVATSNQIGIAPNPVAVCDVENVIRHFAEQNLAKTALKRSLARHRLQLSPAISRATIGKLSTEKKVLDLVTATSARLLKQIQESQNDNSLESVYRKELKSLQKQLAKPTVTEILEFIPGKELLAKLVPMSGCPNSKRFVRGAVNHLDPEDFELFRKLRDRLRSRFSRTT